MILHPAGVATNAVQCCVSCCCRWKTEAIGHTHKLPLMTVIMLSGGFRLQNMLIDSHDLR